MTSHKILRIKLTPLEAYFLGGERIFEFDGNPSYYIHSLNEPSQTTLFGVLRYLGIDNPSADFQMTSSDKANIGVNSFTLVDTNGKYGKIIRISPLYLMDEKSRYYIRAPKDDQNNDLPVKHYTPWKNYGGHGEKDICTTDGTRRYPLDYAAKNFIVDGWLCLSDRIIRDDLFTGVERVGIYKKNKLGAFVKRELKKLAKGFSFVFFAEVEYDFTCRNMTTTVSLGQKKSPFKAEVSEGPDISEPAIPKDLINPELVYACSDAYISDIKELYKKCLFVCAQAKDIRVFKTNYKKGVPQIDRYEKDTHIRLISAGSVFWPDPAAFKDFKDEVKNSHAAVAGFNRFYYKGDEL